MILLLLSPYLYLLIIIFFGGRWQSSGSFLPNIILVHLCFIIAVFIPNMIYAFVLAAHRESSKTLLFWDMLLKLCNIPVYVLFFILGTVFLIVPFGILFTFLIVVFDYLLLLPSTMYGISGLIQARREKKLTIDAVVVSGILHFLFCTDVVSAVVMFCKVRAYEKKQPADFRVPENFEQNAK